MNALHVSWIIVHLSRHVPYMPYIFAVHFVMSVSPSMLSSALVTECLDSPRGQVAA
jgi:hypothetical protein